MVAGVATGVGDHSLVWTDEDQLYSFGKGESGQLGHAICDDISLPRALYLDL
jgi:alpha-tubulin suppressor-like RCC1 family protein